MSAHETLTIRAVVIDDDPAVGRTVCDWLAPAALTVDTYTHAAAGLESLARRPCQLVLVDIGLPDCDETEIIRQSRAARPEAAVLAMATFPEPEQIEQALAAGARAVVPKPLRQNVLLETIRQTLRSLGLYETSEQRFNRRLGRRIRELRAARGISQQALAQAAGLSPGQLSHIEAGRTGTTVWRLARFAAALRMPLSELLEDL